MLKTLLIGGTSACFGIIIQFNSAAAVPDTPKRPVVDEYFGTKIIDDYRWLEASDNAEVKEWTHKQQDFSRSILDAISSREQIASRLKDLYLASSSTYTVIREAGGTLFSLKKQPLAEQLILVSLSSADNLASEKVIFDPNHAGTNGSASINLFWPSPNGKLVAVSLTRGGSEEGELLLYESATGKPLPDHIPRIAFATAGGALAWKEDSSGFYYTRYPRPGERPKEDLDFYERVYFHKLGSDEKKDEYVFGKDFPRIAEITIQTLPHNAGLIVGYQLGDGGDFEFFRIDGGGSGTQIARLEDGLNQSRSRLLGISTSFLSKTHRAEKY